MKKKKITVSQKKYLQAVNKGIEKGDITLIAYHSGFTREYVGKVLNPFSDSYNEKIITEAIKVIEQRAKKRKRVLDALPV